MMQHPDLVQAAYAGDPAAIEQLLRDTQPSLTRFARKYCATPQDVEDAVQETLWIVYRKIGMLRVTKAFVSWAFSIVRHECLRLLRRDEPTTISALDVLEHIADEDNALYAELQQDVVRAIAYLPSHYRQVLILRDVQDLTAPETAEMLNLTVEMVKARLHRARALLREYLAVWSE
jgi:RNA polymerase sigma factor (sigma-70 family)